MGGALSVVGGVESGSTLNSTVTKGSVLTNLDAGDGGVSSGTELRAVDKLNETKTSLTVLGLEGRFYLNESTYVPGGLGFVSTSTDVTNRNDKRDTDKDGAGTTTSDVSTFSETTTTGKGSALIAGVGIGLIERSDAVTVRVEQLITLTRGSVSEESRTVKSNTVDHLDATNNTSAATGLSQTEDSTSFEINLPMRATLDVAVSESWTWRAGVEADLMSLLSSASEETVNKANAANDAFVKDFTRTLADDSSLKSPDGVNTLFGLAYEPVDNLSLDMVFNKAFLTNGFFANGLATKFSVTYNF